MSRGGGGVGEAYADAVDTAIGAGEDFQAEAIFYNHLAGERDVAGDLRHEAAERSGFIVLWKAESGGIVSRVAGNSVAA
jgi:hypothetical protein